MISVTVLAQEKGSGDDLQNLGGLRTKHASLEGLCQQFQEHMLRRYGLDFTVAQGRYYLPRRSEISYETLDKEGKEKRKRASQSIYLYSLTNTIPLYLVIHVVTKLLRYHKNYHV